jgi:hypothetical protein
MDMASTPLPSSYALLLHLVSLVGLTGCSGTALLTDDANALADAAMADDVSADGGVPHDASAPDTGPDASLEVASCVDGVRTVAQDDDDLRAVGLGPLGDGWAVIVDSITSRMLVRLDGDGAPVGDPIAFDRPIEPGGRGAILLRPLADGVIVRSGTNLHYFAPDGSQPFSPTRLAPLVVLGPSTDDAVLGVSGNDVVRIALDETGITVEHFPTGLDLASYQEPTDGYITARSMGVSADGCLAVAALTFSYEMPATLRTLPVIPGAACADVTHAWPGVGSFGVFDSLRDGRFVTIAGLHPELEVSRSHVAQLATLGGASVVAQGETFGMPLSYGVRGAIASAPDRTILATMHASGYGENQVWFWRTSGGTPEAITTDGRSERTAVYLAWHPRLDRVAAVYGTDSAGYTLAEHTLGLRCDL